MTSVVAAQRDGKTKTNIRRVVWQRYYLSTRHVAQRPVGARHHPEVSEPLTCSPAHQTPTTPGSPVCQRHPRTGRPPTRGTCASREGGRARRCCAASHQGGVRRVRPAPQWSVGLPSSKPNDKRGSDAKGAMTTSNRWHEATPPTSETTTATRKTRALYKKNTHKVHSTEARMGNRRVRTVKGTHRLLRKQPRYPMRRGNPGTAASMGIGCSAQWYAPLRLPHITALRPDAPKRCSTRKGETTTLPAARTSKEGRERGEERSANSAAAVAGACQHGHQARYCSRGDGDAAPIIVAMRVLTCTPCSRARRKVGAVDEHFDPAELIQICSGN